MLHKQTAGDRKWLLISILAFIAVFIAGMSIGASSLSLNRLWPVILGHGTFKEEFILYSVRLPRILILALAGMALAVSGALLQSLTRNDLADPGIIGINAGAGLGITCFYLFVRSDIPQFAYVLPVVAFSGALLAAAVIYLFSYEKVTGIQPVKLVLIGVGTAFALNGLMMILVSSAERREVEFIAMWIAGNVWGADWPFILVLLPWLLISLPFVFYKAGTLNVLALSEPAAIGLGVHLNKTRLIFLAIAVALAAAAVSVTGGISFVGLMAPHMAKRLVGPRHQHFMPVALLIGAILMMAADTIGRNLLEAHAIPAGVIAAMIGAPYFLYLLKKV